MNTMSGKSRFAGFDEKQNNGFGIRAEHQSLQSENWKPLFVKLDCFWIHTLPLMILG